MENDDKTTSQPHQCKFINELKNTSRVTGYQGFAGSGKNSGWVFRVGSDSGRKNLGSTFRVGFSNFFLGRVRFGSKNPGFSGFFGSGSGDPAQPCWVGCYPWPD